jgi:DNA-binding NarL/FixJ family response regulator
MRRLADAELRERYGLTERQVAVARLIAEGCTNAELAARLGLSFYTVRNHAEQVMAKLGVGNRSAGGADAGRAGGRGRRGAAPGLVSRARGPSTARRRPGPRA